MDTTEIELLTENIDFGFRDDYKNDTTAIEILKGTYKGIIFRFINVKIIEEDDVASVKFTFDILKNKKNRSTNKLMENVKFHMFLGQILNTILFNNLNEAKFDNNRQNNTEKFID